MAVSELLSKKQINVTVIGAGFMGSAIITGLKKSFSHIILTVTDSDEKKLKKYKETDIITTKDNIEACRNADIIYLAVKPAIIPIVAEHIKNVITDKQLIISIAAGVKTETIENSLGKNANVIRIMPNICANVLEGALCYCYGKNADTSADSIVDSQLNSLGKAWKVEEKLMDAVTGLSGSGPAFIFMIIEALSDGGVLCGLPRDLSNALAAQTVYGSAKMYLETGFHAGALKDMVTSPGGTTIQGVEALEDSGIRNAFIKAVKRATEQSIKFSQNK